MSERIATTEARPEGQNPPEIAYWERGNGGWLVTPSRGSRRR